MRGAIYKYPLENGIISKLPVGEVVLVAQQGDRELPTLWIHHKQETIWGPDDAPKQVYQICRTGQPFDDDGWVHVGSCICGDFVWHVYRLK